jgi:hypothetical protein
MRFSRTCAASLGFLAVVAAGCASSQGGGAGSESVTADAASGKIGPAFLQWVGNFKATQQQSAAFGGMLTRNAATGTVVLVADGPKQMHVRMDVSISNNDPVRLPWAIASGDCGSNALPLMTVAQFPELTASNGRATLDASLPLPMPVTGSYHVNVFNPGTYGADEADVMICAPLTLKRRGN